VPGEVHTLIQNTTIQNSVKNVYYAYPRDIAGEDARLSTYDADDPENTKVEITPEDIDKFAIYAKQELLEIEANETESTLLIKPKHGSYRGDKGPYSFFINGRDVISPVYIDDEVFLQRLSSGEVRLHEQDLLKVRLKTIQKLDVNNDLSSLYYITEVLEYKPGTRQEQSSLDLEE
jgi:CBS-domain-containing membrane protein